MAICLYGLRLFLSSASMRIKRIPNVVRPYYPHPCVAVWPSTRLEHPTSPADDKQETPRRISVIPTLHQPCNEQ